MLVDQILEFSCVQGWAAQILEFFRAAAQRGGEVLEFSRVICHIEPNKSQTRSSSFGILREAKVFRLDLELRNQLNPFNNRDFLCNC